MRCRLPAPLQTCSVLCIQRIRHLCRLLRVGAHRQQLGIRLALCPSWFCRLNNPQPSAPCKLVNTCCARLWVLGVRVAAAFQNAPVALIWDCLCLLHWLLHLCWLLCLYLINRLQDSSHLLLICQRVLLLWHGLLHLGLLALCNWLGWVISRVMRSHNIGNQRIACWRTVCAKLLHRRSLRESRRLILLRWRSRRTSSNSTCSIHQRTSHQASAHTRSHAFVPRLANGNIANSRLATTLPALLPAANRATAENAPSNLQHPLCCRICHLAVGCRIYNTVKKQSIKVSQPKVILQLVKTSANTSSPHTRASSKRGLLWCHAMLTCGLLIVAGNTGSSITHRLPAFCKPSSHRHARASRLRRTPNRACSIRGNQ